LNSGTSAGRVYAALVDFALKNLFHQNDRNYDMLRLGTLKSFQYHYAFASLRAIVIEGFRGLAIQSTRDLSFPQTLTRVEKTIGKQTETSGN